MSTNPKCRFGAMEVVATVVSPALIQCFTPFNTDYSVDTPYNYQDKVLEVSLNGVDWTTSSRSFTFYDFSRVFVSTLEPQGGPLAGGTEIMVHGSSFRFSDHLRCTWDGNRDRALKVAASFVGTHTLKCISPLTGLSGNHSLEVSLDDHIFTNHVRQWTYYDPAQLIISAVDPIGGPVLGGTTVEVIGTGFAQLGGRELHGSSNFAADNFPDALRSVDHGVFCKFSFDAPRATRDDVCTDPFPYQGMIRAGHSAMPREGEAAVSRSVNGRHLQGASCFTRSTTPSLGRMSSVMQATFLDSGRMLCEAPAFTGVMRNNHGLLRVHVTLNGDFHEVNSLSSSNVTYTIYDPREARIQSLSRIGGPMEGGTYLIARGKLLFDLSSVSRPDYAHHLRCRFGTAGANETLATLLSENAVACYSPAVHGFGHRHSVSVAVTLNGQDYLTSRNLEFLYSPLDAYQLTGDCLNAVGQIVGGVCNNNFSGIAVSELQPFGGPSSGNTYVIVTGRLFQVQGPSIMCKFGNMSMVDATFLNHTAIACISPPNPNATGSFEDHFVEVTLNGEQNFLTNSRVPFVYYNHNATVAVSQIYPQAGPKAGGNIITVYGSGFRTLGGELKRPCDGNWTNGTATSELAYGEARTEGSLSRDLEKVVGDSRTCAEPVGEGTNRGLQCLFGNLPAVHAYLLRVRGTDPLRPLAAGVPMEDDPRVGTALICQLPALTEVSAAMDVPNVDWLQGQRNSPLPGEPKSVCLEVTLNGDRLQGTRNCIEFTYYDV